jgi:hypothetical protein
LDEIALVRLLHVFRPRDLPFQVTDLLLQLAAALAQPLCFFLRRLGGAGGAVLLGGGRRRRDGREDRGDRLVHVGLGRDRRRDEQVHAEPAVARAARVPQKAGTGLRGQPGPLARGGSGFLAQRAHDRPAGGLFARRALGEVRHEPGLFLRLRPHAGIGKADRVRQTDQPRVIEHVAEDPGEPRHPQPLDHLALRPGHGCLPPVIHGTPKSFKLL